MRFTPLTLLLILPLAAADIDFKEQFADPASRSEALTSLVPGTRDWFFLSRPRPPARRPARTLLHRAA